MELPCSSSLSSEIVRDGFSRRGFLRLSALAALPLLTEAQRAHSQRRPMMHPGEGVHIDANENPMGPCPAALDAIREIASHGGRYEFNKQFELAALFAKAEGLPEGSVQTFAGSTDPLAYTVLSYTGPGRSLVTADPGYEAPYDAAAYAGAKLHKIPLAANYAHDVRAMLAAAPDAGLFYVCNPNNPTGTVTPYEEIEYLVAHKPKGSVVLIDEAYIHLSNARSALDMVKAGKDVVILRTFSKLYGMAGIRCGFAIGRPDLLKPLGNFGMPIVSITATAAARASLLDSGLVSERKKQIAAIRAETFDWLTANKYKFIPSDSNCFMIDTGRPGHEVISAMAERKIFIGRLWPIWPTSVRITVGSREDMAAFQNAFKQVMDSKTAAYRNLPLPPRLELTHRTFRS